MLKIAILISGRGSNMQALIAAAKSPDCPYNVACVISNKPDAAGLAHAESAGIATEVVDHKVFADRAAFEHALSQKLTGHGVQLVCLAGFMRLLTPWFVERWRDRLVNIHPSLLPSFPGLETHHAALAYGAKLHGCTVHFVRTEMDHGPIIAQAAVPVLPSDSEDILAARVLRAEHQLYPMAVRLIAEGRVNVLDEKVFIADAAATDTALLNPSIVLNS